MEVGSHKESIWSSWKQNKPPPKKNPEKLSGATEGEKWPGRLGNSVIYGSVTVTDAGLLMFAVSRLKLQTANMFILH